MELIIDGMKPGDWEEVRAIYGEGIATGNSTFEGAAPEWAEWDRRYRKDCRLVARFGGKVVGWAAVSPVSSRCVYEGVGEISLYVAAEAWGRGVGKALMRELIEATERAGIWTLQAGIFPENTASVALAKFNGMREVGVREKLGRMNGLWRDVLLLERRSRVAGV